MHIAPMIFLVLFISPRLWLPLFAAFNTVFTNFKIFTNYNPRSFCTVVFFQFDPVHAIVSNVEFQKLIVGLGVDAPRFGPPYQISR
jgi:hypothetical protein